LPTLADPRDVRSSDLVLAPVHSRWWAPAHSSANRRSPDLAAFEILRRPVTNEMWRPRGLARDHRFKFARFRCVRRA